MTNVFLPLGFIPIRNKFTSGTGTFGQYTLSATDTSIIGLNDLVKRSGGNTITKANAGDTPIGFFQGWYWRTRSAFGGQMGMAADAYISPFRKVWNGAVSQVNPNQYIEALVDDDPAETFRVQCFGTINQANIGALVDLADAGSGPDVTVMGRGKQAVGTPTTYFLITGFTVTGGGSGYTQNGVDLVINGQVMDINPASITVSGGVVTALALLNQVSVPSNTPTLTLQPKPGFAGSGATITGSFSGSQTASQFRVERIFEQAFRSQDAQFNTQGFDLTAPGLYAWVEVAFAKHGRLGTALYA